MGQAARASYLRVRLETGELFSRTQETKARRRTNFSHHCGFNVKQEQLTVAAFLPPAQCCQHWQWTIRRQMTLLLKVVKNSNGDLQKVQFKVTKQFARAQFSLFVSVCLQGKQYCVQTLFNIQQFIKFSARNTAVISTRRNMNEPPSHQTERACPASQKYKYIL